MSSHETTTNASHQHRHQLEWCKFSKRVALKSILGRSDGGVALAGERVVVGGWVMSCKEKSAGEDDRLEKAEEGLTCSEVLVARVPPLRCVVRAFMRAWNSPEPSRRKPPAKAVKMVVCLRINDGSCVANLQVILDSSMSLINQVISHGSSILVEGFLQEQISAPSSSSSTRNHGAVELKAEKILHVGIVDSKTYPLAEKNSSLEFIRDFPHLRPRTRTIASITRIRNAITYSTHNFFQNIGFININTPIITSTTSKNHNKTFQLAPFLTKPNDAETLTKTHNEKEEEEEGEGEGEGEAITIDVLKAAIREKKDKIEELKRSDSNREALLAALLDLQKANEIASRLEKKGKMEALDQGSVDLPKDFFACKAYLVSSSLLGFHLESYACGLGSVYAVAPVLHPGADDKKLAELWMVEVEVAFSELEDAMNCAETFIKFLCSSILEGCHDEIKFLSKRIDKHCIERLRSTKSTTFARITYSQAVEGLKKVMNKISETNAGWGVNLSEEHKRYLCDEIYKRPIIIYDYPKEAKPFFVRIKEDGRTASAFDIIAPKVGVLVQGGQKEERFNVITSRIQELGLAKEDYEWYFDLRKHGTVKHCGFSLGIEDMVTFATGIEDAKDVIPFPRAYGHLKA